MRRELEQMLDERFGIDHTTLQVDHSRGEDNAPGFPVKHRAGYYFAVLEDLLGLREPPAAESTPESGPKPSTR